MINRRLLIAWWVASFLVACDCASLGLEQKRFSCATDDECSQGFMCVDRGSGLECVASSAGGGAAGGVAGGTGGAGGAAGGDAGATAGGDGGGTAGGDGGGTAGGDAGGMAGGDAGGAAGGDAGGMAGGTSGGQAGGASGGQAGGTSGGQAGGAMSQVPTQLGFSTPVRSQPTSLCSSAITIEARNAMGQMVPITTSISVALGVMQATSGISFFSSATCSTAAISSVVLTTAAPTQTVFIRGTTAGTFTLTASAMGLMAATQSTTVTLGPDTLAFTNTPPAGLRGGECFPLTYQSRRGAMPLAVTVNTTITFGPASGAKFYADPTCSTQLASQVLASGASLDTVFVRVLVSTTLSLTATAPFDGDAITVTALPIVRRGTCFFRSQTALDGGFDPDGGAIDAGFSVQLTQTCAVSPPVGNLAQAMLLVQELGSQPGEHNDVMARCRLSNQSTITCVRRQGAHGLEVRWQVVELSAGLRVQAVTSGSCATSVPIPQAVDPAKSFVLRTLGTTTGGFYDDEDGTPFFLANATTVSAPAQNSCGGFDLQVVEWDGLSVTRGTLDGGLAAGVVSQSVLGLPPASTNRAVLVQAALDTDLMANTCALQVRGSLPGPSELALRRAMGDAGCGANLLPRVVWERLDFGTRATAREVTVTFGPGVQLVDTPITAVDPGRTFLLSSNQTTMGQGMGETDYAPFTKIAEAAFGFDLTSNGTVLTTRRGRSSGSAVVTVYVVQVE
ncbi:MAG: hypothetical protein Q8N26_00255 [Myxococcales bacterium]|nr:hypothetical protein [Myxococcales bacterium]